MVWVSSVVDQKLTDILAELVKKNAVNHRPNMQQVSGLSQALLSGVGVQNPYKSQEANNSTDSRGPSVINRVLDIMSRPLYGVLTPIKKEIEANRYNTPDPGIPELIDPANIWAGLTGKEKTTGKDVLNASENFEQMPGGLKAATGFGIDVLADPLTYVGGLGLLGKVGKGAKLSTEALESVATGTGKTAQNLSEEISRKAALQADKLAPPMPKQLPPINNLATEAQKIPLPTNNIPGSDVGLSSAFKPPGEVFKKQQLLSGFPNELEGILKPDLKQLAAPKMDAFPATKLPALEDLSTLNKQANAVKTPVAKSILQSQVNKLSKGIEPADILNRARKAPAPFPDLTIAPRWIDTARNVAQDFLKSNRLQTINQIGQSKLYSRIVHAVSKVPQPQRQMHVLQMLRIAEEEILQAGRKLTDAENISVRLSDLANMAGGPRSLTSKLVDDFRRAKPIQQLEDLKAHTTPQVVSDILDPVLKTGADLAEDVKNLPPSQIAQTGGDISSALTKIARQAGASSVEAKTAKAFIDDLFTVDRDKLYSAIEQEARSLVRQSSTGIINPQTLHKISEETYKALGANPKLLGRQIEQSKVTEGIMTKFATWWGAKDLKPFSREYIDTARNVAAAFSEALKPLVRSTTPTQRKIAWSVATGKAAAGTPEELALANQFKYLVERLMGTHGITENAEAVVLRSGTLMNELNDELPVAMKLVDKKGADDLGRVFDYTDGNWMHSWKEWKTDEPAETLYQLTRSLQLVTRKNAMWDDAAARWGMPIKGAEFQHQAGEVGRLKGTYFPKEIANQLNALQGQLERDVFKTPHKAIELFDKVQRMWKTGVTIYSPSHHIRNLNGDIYLAALDGVVSVRPYTIATKVLHAFPSRYKSLESVFNIMDPQLRDRALRARPGNVVLTTKAGDKLTSEQVYQAAESQGLFIRAMHIEDLAGDKAPAFGTFGPKFKPFGGKVYDVATGASELRDHWVRLAHFVDILGKSKQPLRVAIEQAGRRVRKFHPDGMDLTGFEQNVMRRVIPFYSWMRKATPLVIEGAIMRPHITLAFPKAMANLQSVTGIESQGPGDPFPMDQMFPDWIKEKGIGPILQPGSGLGRDETWRGEAPGYTIVNPTNPFMDQIAQIGSPGKTILSSLSPAARIPMELLQGQTSLGIPLENVEGGIPGHLAQQIPAIGIGARLTGMTRDNEPWNPEQLINYLTSAGVTGTGPYQGQAQMEIRQLLTEMAKKNRGDYR